VTDSVYENVQFYTQLLNSLNICWRKGVKKKYIKENETEILCPIYFQAILFFLMQLEKGSAMSNFLNLYGKAAKSSFESKC